jgi:hypothetical protein
MYVRMVDLVCICYREGIDWADIEWVDNVECLDLVEKVGVSLCVCVGRGGGVVTSWTPT